MTIIFSSRTITTASLCYRFSMFDALDLEYALRRAAARGSVGTYSFSESLHKLTFTQSLAFPALARNLAHKQAGVQSGARQPQQHGESGMNVFAKVVTALVLVLVSFLVFGVVYKFVRTWGWLLVPTAPGESLRNGGALPRQIADGASDFGNFQMGQSWAGSRWSVIAGHYVWIRVFVSWLSFVMVCF